MAKARDKSSDPPPEQGLPFEQALAELDSIVRRIEAGELSLEESLLAYQRGAMLVRQCRDTLSQVEQQVLVLEGDLLRPMADGLDQADGAKD